MKASKINYETMMKTFSIWQEENRAVEVVIRLCQGLTQTHSGYIAVEPDGRIVVAHVVDKDNYFTTVIDASEFDSISMIESENAITFTRESEKISGLKTITIACRQQ